MNNVKNGFFTLNRMLGKKNKDSSHTRSTSNLSQSMLHLDITASSQNLNTNSEDNKIVPLSNMTNAPFEQTFRITVSLPRGQLYVARLGAKTQLSVLLQMICDDKQLDKNMWAFCHPIDRTQTFHNELTIGLVGLSELRLLNVLENSIGDEETVYSTNEVVRLRNEHRNSYVSPYSSMNSLNSMDSVGLNQHTFTNPTVPVRKKRLAPRPPSQYSINNVNNSKNEISIKSNGNNEFLEKNQIIHQKPFHVSSPNLSFSNNYVKHPFGNNDNSEIIINNSQKEIKSDATDNTIITDNTVHSLHTVQISNTVLSSKENVDNETIVKNDSEPEPTPRRRLISGAKKKIPAPKPRSVPPVPLPRIKHEKEECFETDASNKIETDVLNTDIQSKTTLKKSTLLTDTKLDNSENFSDSLDCKIKKAEAELSNSTQIDLDNGPNKSEIIPENIALEDRHSNNLQENNSNQLLQLQQIDITNHQRNTEKLEISETMPNQCIKESKLLEEVDEVIPIHCKQEIELQNDSKEQIYEFKDKSKLIDETKINITDHANKDSMLNDVSKANVVDRCEEETKFIEPSKEIIPDELDDKSIEILVFTKIPDDVELNKKSLNNEKENNIFPNRSVSPVWLYTLPAPPNFADSFDENAIEKQISQDSTIIVDLSHNKNDSTDIISENTIPRTNIIKPSNEFMNIKLKTTEVFDSLSNVNEDYNSRNGHDLQNSTCIQITDNVQNELNNANHKHVLNYEAIENSKNHVIEQLNSVINHNHSEILHRRGKFLQNDNGECTLNEIPKEEYGSSLPNFKLATYATNKRTRTSSFTSNTTVVDAKSCDNEQINLQKQSPIRSINRSVSFHSTRFEKTPSYLSLSTESTEFSPNRRKSSSELSIIESPSLQSIEVLKLILPTLTLNKKNKEEKVEEPKIEEPHIKNNNEINENKNRWKFQGPPAIHFSSWSERPKSQVIIKSDSDYKFGGSITVDNENLETNFNKHTESLKPKQEQPVRLPVVRMVEYKKTAFISDNMKKNEENINYRNNSYTNISRPQSMYVESSYSSNKSTIPTLPLKTDAQIFTKSNNSSVPTNTIFSIIPGNNNNNNKFIPVVRGFKLNDSNSNFKSKTIIQSKENDLNDIVTHQKPNRESVYEIKSKQMQTSNIETKNFTSQFSQNILRRTGFKDKILSETDEKFNLNSPSNIQANFREHNDNNNQIMKKNNTVLQKSVSNNGPPKAPPPPKIIKFQPEKKIVKKSFENDVDPRDQLLSAIRNFNPCSLKKN